MQPQKMKFVPLTDPRGGIFRVLAIVCFAVACGLMAGSLQWDAIAARNVSGSQPSAANAAPGDDSAARPTDTTSPSR